MIEFTPPRASHSAAVLPPPRTAALQHSAQLRALIVGEIAAAGGAISFARYMELALYAPGLGYYSAGAQKFGAAGDFITAPEISPLFAHCVARQWAQVLRTLGGGDVLEVGAGSGVFAADLLTALAEADSLPIHYFILERSADLRARQQLLLAARDPQLLERIIWLDGLPSVPLSGVVIANELLDALPVHLFSLTDGGPEELYVASEDNGFYLRPQPLSNVGLRTRIEAIWQEVTASALPSGYVSEINLAADGWVRSIAEVLAAGALLLIDYGFPRHEYYHPQRQRGTLMCHYRHHAHDDPFLLPGLQDITAHVDFTAVAEAAAGAGLDVAGYTTQVAFLLGSCITDALAGLTEKRLLQLAQGVKKLSLPHDMCVLFKVMALTRGLDEPLLGFALRDLRARL